MRGRATCLLVGIMGTLAGCGRPARFPPGGEVRATGLCEADLDRPPDRPTSARGPWLAQSGGGPSSEGYGYGLADASGNVVLRFESGRLTSISVEERSDGFDPHARGAPPPLRRAEGARDQVFVEGRSYDVALRSTDGASTETVRVRFEGERVHVAWRRREGLARCAWEP